MFFINISNILTLILILLLTGLVIYLGKETKKSWIPALLMGLYIVLLLVYLVQLVYLPEGFADVGKSIGICMAIDFALIMVTYLSYLWIDDIEAKQNNQKSISNELDWLWKKV